jgi:gamma-glutamylcyclotransferase (GGCT)/AIG2-like uncharacterized protein YtfP
LSDDVDDVVFGELFRLHHADEILREFDMYEACGEDFPQPTEYLRQTVEIALGNGDAREAWTYLYNWPVDRLQRIASGRFLVG